jgi:hypothetical protein
MDTADSRSKKLAEASVTGNPSDILAAKPIVTPQNRHLADYSDQATIYMMSLWKRTTKRLVHVGACT